MSDTTTSRTAKFLVCVDGRDESRVALHLACQRARRRGGKVDMLHVIIPADFQSLQGVAERMREEQQQEADALMQRLCQDAFTYCGITPGVVLREGQPGDEIIAAATDDPEVNMIVLGASNVASRGKLSAWLAGQLGHKLFVPLLLVPGNLTDQQLAALT